MGSFTTIGQGIGTNLVGLGENLNRSLSGHPDLVHLIDPVTNSSVLQIDAILSENHQRDSPATSFPLEDGTNISDHIFVAPFELTFQGVISDAPLGDKRQLITEAFATGYTAIAPPLGVAAVGTAYGLFLSDLKTNSPSKTAFQKLLMLQAGDPTASPPIPPKPLNVSTKLKLYENMVIRSLSVPRDAGMSDAIAFQVTMSQLIIVRPQSVNIQVLSNKALASARANEGEQETKEPSAFQKGYALEKQNAQTVKGVVNGVLGRS